MTEATLLPQTSLTLAQARTTLSGLHFAKDALSEREREVLYIAEGLLRLVDQVVEGSNVPTEMLALRDLAMMPGVHSVCIYPDGVEVVGGPGDLDASAGFVNGEWSPAQVREAVGPHLPIEDLR